MQAQLILLAVVFAIGLALGGGGMAKLKNAEIADLNETIGTLRAAVETADEAARNNAQQARAAIERCEAGGAAASEAATIADRHRQEVERVRRGVNDAVDDPDAVDRGLERMRRRDQDPGGSGDGAGGAVPAGAARPARAPP